MKTHWNGRAITNLHHIREHIRLENPAAAEGVGSRIESAVARLSRFPESGRIGDVSGTRELVVPGLPYVVIYRLKGEAVHVLRILHERQKWPPAFQ